MRLRVLAADLADVAGEGDPEITSLSADSREVLPGALFAALGGTRVDGDRFVREALARGAVALLGRPELAAEPPSLPILTSTDPRRALARIAARFSGAQPAIAVAVTGTNGKSSVVTFTRQIWASAELPAASLGTLGISAPGLERPLPLTTPGPIELHAHLADLARRGVGHVAFEASSHALDQRRLDGVVLAAAAFTNLTRDHFDYHGGLEPYFAAKARLLAELLPEGACAVLNADSDVFERLRDLCAARKIEVVDCGRAARRLRLVSQSPTPTGQRLGVEIDGRAATLESPLVGAFQAENLLVAAGLALATGTRGVDLPRLMAQVRGARGRVQRVAELSNGAAVFVDYAHTPDAVARMLEALRPHCAGQLSVVLGAGGDRDPGKRPLMGEAASRAADRVYVTDDNPRSEDPAAVRRAVLAGAPGAVDAGDRRRAIFRAVGDLGPGDLLVIAGKGHETGQTVAGVVHPFDDAAVAAEAVAALGRGAAA